MKKLFFSFLAISLLSTSAVLAGKGKTAKKNIDKKECPAPCPKPAGCGHMHS